MASLLSSQVISEGERHGWTMVGDDVYGREPGGSEDLHTCHSIDVIIVCVSAPPLIQWLYFNLLY